MDRSARAWLVTVAADHYWRVAHWYEFDDLIQDGHMVWWRIVAHYETIPGRIRSRPHLMTLFKRSYLNHLHDLSKTSTISKVEFHAEDMMTGAPPGEDEPWDLIVSHDAGEYERLIAEAPQLLQPILQYVISGPPSRMLQSEYRVERDGTRETTNSRFCRLVGIDPNEFDLVTELRAYLTR